jgi:DNA-binding IclR family transcriptional regulator
MSIPRTHALDRAVDVLVGVVDSGSPISASALSRETGQPRPTVSRTLRTLLDRGLVAETPDGWIAGYELLRLGRLADPRAAVVEAARQPLRALRDRTGESALLAIVTGRPEMEIVEQLDAPHHLAVVGWVGADVPLHASSAGKLLLAELTPAELDTWFGAAHPARLTSRTISERASLDAELTRIRRRGWAEIVDELELGLVSLSAPIRDRTGTLVAMVGVSGPSTRLTPSRRRALPPVVNDTASAIERALAP